MRHGASGRRSRNRGNGRRGGNQNSRTQVFDSNGPDVRIRGTAYQIHEKYMALARDAAGMGDRILEQSYLQHSEHYQRLINSWVEDGQGRDERRYGSVDQAVDDHVESDNFNRSQPTAAAATREDDLALPASILGTAAKTDEFEKA